ncbi:protein of unknown function [Ekhidna lutea]|uniref:SiaC family regulatory phosphoprotein domain-containing protein n=1 Tax=Ekhidna lutea TaxID=447679 RepID=A0A239K6W4_EKHLU|nr:SiaC family regulatory phosphoprotein [Ekhidna lutea]SNT12914.1 protein of unknown function [Ekhidna lutea]
MDYFRKATATSPAVIMDAQYQSVLIKGSSTCINMDEYGSVLKVIQVQLNRGNYSDVNIKLSHFNTRAAKALLLLFKSIKTSNKSIAINWVYDKSNEEMKQMGQDYSDLLEMEFNFSCN